jgi:hypothetical protein
LSPTAQDPGVTFGSKTKCCRQQKRHETTLQVRVPRNFIFVSGKQNCDDSRVKFGRWEAASRGSFLAAMICRRGQIDIQGTSYEHGYRRLPYCPTDLRRIIRGCSDFVLRLQWLGHTPDPRYRVAGHAEGAIHTRFSMPEMPLPDPFLESRRMGNGKNFRRISVPESGVSRFTVIGLFPTVFCF